jgi:hypothetical protein
MKLTAMGGRASLLALSACAAMSASACDSGPQPPHGSPILVKVYWVAGGMQSLVWSMDTADLVPAVPPFGSEIDFVFDRRLNGDLIEDTIKLPDGTITTRPTAIPPITASWPDMAAPTEQPPFKMDVSYNSMPRFGGETSYVFARPAIPGFPADGTITFTLIHAKLASAYGEPMGLPDNIVVKTTLFSVSINVPGGDGGSAATVGTDFQVPLAFSNRLPSTTVVANFVKVRDASGGLVPFKLLADAGVASRLYLVPADCLKAWPAKAKLAVTVEAGLPDAFGVKLPLPAKATFTTGAGSSVTQDASTCPASDGGAGDSSPSEGGTPDGDASDVGAPDGGVPDAEAGTEDTASDSASAAAEVAPTDASAAEAD